MSRTEKAAMTLVALGLALLAVACSGIGRMTGVF